MVSAALAGLQQYYADEGELVSAEGNRPLIIQREQSVWIVETGHADVFSVEVRGGEVVNRRRFLFAVEPGQLLFGYADADAAARVGGLLVAGLTGTRLRQIGRARFFALLGEAESAVREEAARQMDSWAAAWQEALGLTEDSDAAAAYASLPAAAAAERLSALNGEIARRLNLVHETADVFEHHRLKMKTDQDDQVMERALRRLATITAEAEGAGRQTESAEGDLLVAAARIVGDSLGIAVTLPPDRQLARSRDKVGEIARMSGFRSRQVLLRDEWWRADNGPLLAYLEEGMQPVALIPRKPTEYVLVNPSDGSETPVTAEAAAAIHSRAHMFYRTLPGHALKIWDILKFGSHRSVRRDLAWVIGLAVAGGLLGMFVPIANGILFDTIIPAAERGLLVQMGFILLSVTIATVLFEFTRGIAMLRIEGRMDGSIQAAVWDRLLSLPVSFFRNYTAGDLASRANSINAIRQMLSGVVVSSLLSGVFSIFNFFLLFYYDTKLALAAAALVLVSMLVTIGTGVLQVRRQRVMLKVQGKLSGTVLQLINGISKFRMAAAEKRAFWLWSKLFGEMKTTSFKARQVSNNYAVFSAVFPVVTSIVLFWLVGSNPSGMSAGMFIAFFAAFTSFLTAMLGMSSAFVSLMNIVPMYERAKPILETVPEVRQSMEDPGELTGAIEVKHVSFRYVPEQPLVLNDLSLSIRPGEFIALVGASGCGKSSLMRLLLGFEKAESGTIYYDGQDLKSLDIRSVRSQLGVVLQHGKVMAGDIFSNIVGSGNLTQQDAWEAARLAGFDQDIQQMPMGMHTVISEGGGTLSGGQRQRMLIARALARRPKILLFDEATSALDNRTQAIVSESLEKLRATRIVIAHRLSTIMNADRIYVLDKGRVVQEGSYAQLMEREGLFLELAKRQLA